MSTFSSPPLKQSLGKNSGSFTPTLIPDEALAKITQLYENGLYLQAYDLAKPYGSLNQWDGTTRIQAGQLASQLGAKKLRRALHILAWRQNRTNADCFYHYLYTLWECQGLFAAWKRLDQAPQFPTATPREQGHLLSLWTAIYYKLRDFEQATQKLDQAAQLLPEDPWIWVVRARLLEAEDRYPEALEAAEQALVFCPQYRPAIGQVAHLLKLQNRDSDALELLQTSVEQLESAELADALAELYLELGDAAIAQKTFEHCLTLSPLAEPSIRAYWIAKIANASYKAKDIVQAQTWAKEISEQPGYEAFANSLLSFEPSGRTIQLPVNFVRQHHMTCAPATLATLCRYWNKPIPHLEIADEICYSGTSYYNSRTWAESKGWIAQEFTVTWDNTQRLIDQGIPFAVSTVEPNSAHMQAVIGYDSHLKLLFVRDPYEREIVEFWADAFFEKYQGSGPRGLVLVPPEKSDDLAPLNLQDHELYTQLFSIQRSLKSNDRETAEQLCQTILETAPQHRLSYEASITLANYDTDQPRLLTHINQILELFPEDLVWLLKKSYCLDDLEYRGERVKFLKELSHQPYSHPVFWQEYAEILSEDARENTVTVDWLKKSLKVMPSDARSYFLLANFMWVNRETQMAFQLYRFATCLDTTNTKYARAYFEVAYQLKQTDEALQFLAQRWQQHQSQSSQPAYTLAWAYHQISRPQDMFAVLKSAQTLHPDDGELLLYRASLNASYGDYPEAETLLAQAKDKAPHRTWLRIAAEIAQYQGQKSTALKLWKEVIQLDPLASDASRALTELLTETQGVQAAQEFLASLCQQYPYCLSLNTLWYLHTRDEDIAQAEIILQGIILNHPDNAWARRQFAWHLSQNQRHEDAFAELAIAQKLAPNSASFYTIQSSLFATNHQIPEAKEALREALRLSIDSEWAIQKLFSLCQSQRDQREALDFIYQELTYQVISGEGLLTYYQQAQSILSSEELLTALKAGLQQRPDLWQTWSTYIQQLSNMGQMAEALTLAKDATEQFPLQTEIWLVLAKIYESEHYQDGELSALKQAAQLSPGSSYAVRQLADAYERAEDLTAGQALLEQAIAHEPLEARNYGFLASNLWKAEQPSSALDMIEKAIRLKPNYDWAWSKLHAWSIEQKQSDAVIKLARELTQSRAGESTNWYRLATYLTDPADAQERLEALDQAIKLDPKDLDAYELKIELLAANQEFDEAIALCQTSVWGDTQPTLLRGQIPWIEAQRGNVKKAIALMKELLAEEDDYHWGWGKLAQWYSQVGDTEQYLAAAQTLVQKLPDTAEAWSLLGEAQIQAEQTQDAKSSYRKALEKKANYSSAAFSLFDLELEDQEFEQAARILEQVREHHENEYYWARVAQLASEQNNSKKALAALTELCIYPTDNEWPIQTAVRAVVQAEWTVEAQSILHKHLSHPQAHPEVGSCWVGCCIVLDQWEECFNVIEHFDPQHALQKEAILFFLQKATNRGQNALIQRYLKSSREILHANNDTWGYVGFYYCFNDDKLAVRWYKDWETRDGLEPWMLIHLSRSLIGLKQYKKAQYVSRRALKLTQDGTTSSHQVLLAFESAWAGSLLEASKLIRAIDETDLVASDHFLYFLAMALLEVQAKKVPSSVLVKNAIARVKQAENAYPENWGGLFWQSLYHRAAWKIALKAPGFRSFFWAYYQGVRQSFSQQAEMNLEGSIFATLLFMIGLYLFGVFMTLYVG